MFARPVRLGLRLIGCTAAAYLLATAVTPLWYEHVWLPRIAGED